MNILIVDDEPALVDYLTKTVSAYFPSHQVRGVVSATDAIGAAYKDGAVDLLIADIHLGDSDGFELSSQLQPAFPDMQTVFISGLDNHTISISAHGVRNFLRKPLGPNDIFGVVEAVQQKIRPRINRRRISRSMGSNSVAMPSIELPVASEHHDAIDPPRPQVSDEARGKVSGLPKKTSLERRKHQIWLPALLSLLTMALVITLIVRDTRLFDHLRQSPVNETAAASRLMLRDLPLQAPDASEVVNFRISGVARLQPVTLRDQFEGSDRPLEMEAQWKVLPQAIGAHEIVVGEGAVRARASELVLALFTPGMVSAQYDWTARLDMRTNDTGSIGFVFGYLNPEDYFLFRINRPALRIEVVRQLDGELVTIWDAAVPDNIVSSKFHVELRYDSVERTLKIFLGMSEVVAKIALGGFEGGHFGLSVAETSFCRFSGFELTLAPQRIASATE